MKITSVLKSVKGLIPKLITRFTSIQKDVEFQNSSKKDLVLLKDSKDISQAKKQVKESLYTIVDSFFSDLNAKDVKSINDKKITINITPNFDKLVNRFYTEIRPFMETFITEKKCLLP